MTNGKRSIASILFLLVTTVMYGCGGSGGSSNPPPPPPPDTAAPTVNDISTAAASSFNRTTTLTVTATDNVGVTEVRFFVDGNLVGTDTTSPYAVDWDTTTVADGDHTVLAEAEDAAGNVGQSSELTLTVANAVQFDVVLTAEQEVPAASSDGTATASFAIDLGTGEIGGEVTTSLAGASAAHIHDQFAGANGPVLVGLEQDPGDASVWRVPAGTVLDNDGIERLLAGALYVNVHTPDNPGGELRGQILTADLQLYFTDLDGSFQVPQVETIATGRAAVTLNVLSGAVVIQANVANLDDADSAHLHDAYAGANGPVLVALTNDPADPARWFVEDGALNSAGLDAFAAGRLYVNVHSPAYPGGEVRGQVIPEGITLLVSDLTGAQEVPAVDTRASAVGFLTHDTNGGLLSIHVNTVGLDDADGAHLHRGFGGLTGGVEIGLTQDGSDPTHWFAELEALSQDQADALLAGETYLNVHTPAHPPGEVRGQVIPDGVLFATGPLEGRQEIPAVDTAGGGTFAVTVNVATSAIEAYANTTGVDDATAAHLHTAYAGDSGPVAIGLEQDPNEIGRWSASAVLTGEQTADFMAGRLYVNVHTPANPPGEIRGQVAPAPVEVLFVTLSGDEEVPVVTTAATGLAAVTTNRDTGAVAIHLRASGADTATAAHLHSAYAGDVGGVLVGLTQDGGDAGHWFEEQGQLDAAGLDDYRQGRSYVNLHTPANPGGELRGQLAPRDIRVLLSPMDGDQVVPAVATGETGVAATTVNLATRRFAIFVNASFEDGLTAGVRRGAAGMNGPEVLALAQDPTVASRWSGVVETLDKPTLANYRAGELYARVTTAAQTEGLIRGQIVPPDAGEFDASPPTVAITSPADAADVDGTIAIEATAGDNIEVTEVRFLADGNLIDTDTSAPYAVQWDTTTVTNGNVTLTAEADDAAGNTGTSAGIVVNVANAAPVTLTQIQSDVFTPACSGCHSGPTSTNLPSGMNLSSTAESFAALVNVQSLQVGSLNRVTPGDPDNSYLIQKLEGTAAVGARMPQGGPFLDQEVIDEIRQWISDGAENN